MIPTIFQKLFEEIQEESKKLESLVKEKQDLENQVTALRQQVTDLRVQKAILEEHQPASVSYTHLDVYKRQYSEKAEEN